MEKVDKYGNGGAPSQLIITDKYGKIKSIYQEKLILTTTGSSGPATLIGTTLNIPQYSGGGSTTWGSITGTLSSQTDLQSALDARVPYIGATTNVNLGEYAITAGQVEFDQTPTGTAGVAIMRWNDQDGTVDLGLKGGNVTLQIGQEQVTRVVNKTTFNLLEANYQVVRISGAQGNRLKVDLAQANNDANSADTIGIVTETILVNQEGFVTTSGLVRNIDTTGTLQGETWLDGNLLYLSGTVAGQITNIKPIAPIHTVIIGYVVRAHATQGQIYVKVDNGYELDELHNVYINSATLADNDLLQYDSATLLWENKSLSAAGVQPTITPGALTKVDDTNVTLTLGGTPSTALLQGVSLTLGWTGTLADARIASAATWNAKQDAITLTTTGTSGPATLVGSTLNIPEYGGGGGASIIKLTLQTLVSASWVLVGSYYTYTFSNVNITTNTRVDFTPENSSYSEVSVCGLLPQVDVAAGNCTFYSLFPPATDIRGEITIIPTI